MIGVGYHGKCAKAQKKVYWGDILFLCSRTDVLLI